MYTTAFPLSVVITAIAGVSLVFAQEPAPSASLVKTGLLGLGAEPGVCSKGGLLRSEAILKELHVTEAQLGRFKQARIESQRIADATGQESQRRLKQLTADRDQEGLAERARENSKRLYGLTRDDERPLVAVLDRDQRLRLEQLQLQADGPWAFKRPEVQNRLRMSPEQVEIVSEIFERGRQAVVQAASVPADAKPVYPGLSPKKRVELLKSKDFSNKVADVRKQVVTARNATMREIAENLNKSQRANFAKMLGERFEFPKVFDLLPAEKSAARGPETLAPQGGKAPVDQ